MIPGSTRLVAQLSDPHVVEPGALCIGRVDTNAFLAAAVQTLLALDDAPDLLLCTGDLVNDGTPAQYAHLRQLLAPLPFPVYLLCGNHDNRAALRAAFPDHGYLGADGPCDYVVEVEPLRIVALDTLIEGSPRGKLQPAQLHWLDRTLRQNSEAPTVVALHHPPFVTGIGHMDAMGLHPASRAGLAEVLAAHGHVERVLCGHLHRSITQRFAGTVAMTVPSCAHAVQLDLRTTDAPGRWTFEPPAVALHRWSADLLVTHLLPVGEFTAYPFGGGTSASAAPG